MHVIMLTGAVAAAVLYRCCWRRVCRTGQPPAQQRWPRALAAFLVPPLYLLTTAIAVVWMGSEGQMVGLPVGYLGYAAAIATLLAAVGVLIFWLLKARRAVADIEALPQITVNGSSGYRLDTTVPFAAQIGLWHPKLVLSQGLLDALSPQHLNAVLVHEQAHAVHRDTFWFFWLGWLRQLTSWLPYTDALWQELLLLRELRADRWAAQRVEGLLLAEALLTVVRHQAEAQVPLLQRTAPYAAFDADLPVERLEERIDALLTSNNTAQPQRLSPWLSALLVLMPALTVFLHY